MLNWNRLEIKSELLDHDARGDDRAMMDILVVVETEVRFLKCGQHPYLQC